MFSILYLSQSILSVFIIFGGAIPYIPQYLEIIRLEDSEGFSAYVCLTLLIANLSRMAFWFGRPYPLPLFAQTFLMVGTMLFMMRICVRYRRNHLSEAFSQQLANLRERHKFTDFDPNYFWKWTDFSSYLQFVALFSISVACYVILFRSNSLFIEALGYFALLTEAMLAVPQLVRNFQKASTTGMSLQMVALWTVGDAVKVVYFLSSKPPTQFLVCGILQISIDVAILGQYLVYNKLK